MISSDAEVVYWQNLARNLVEVNIEGVARDYADVAARSRLVEDLLAGLHDVLAKPTLPRLKKFCGYFLEPYAEIYEPYEFGMIENQAIREHMQRVHGPKLEADVAAILARARITTERQYRLAMNAVERWLGDSDKAADLEKLNESLRAYEARLQKRIDRARARR